MPPSAASTWAKSHSPFSFRANRQADVHQLQEAPLGLDHTALRPAPPPPLPPSAYTAPRSAPRPPPPPPPAKAAFFGGIVPRAPPRAPSTGSLRSAYTAASSQADSALGADNKLHPYSHMPAPLPVISGLREDEDEAECPVCLEPLSFSFRLPGEKPHIVPECGHALHEVSHRSPSLPPLRRCAHP
jgi:hypothetical protein